MGERRTLRKTKRVRRKNGGATPKKTISRSIGSALSKAASSAKKLQKLGMSSAVNTLSDNDEFILRNSMGSLFPHLIDMKHDKG